MSEMSAKSFKVPKIRRQESKDNLRLVDVKSRDCQELVNVVKRSYISSNYQSKWQVKSAAFVDNRTLESSYRAKKSEMKEGRHSRDMVDQYAFLVVKEAIKVPMIVKNGLRCGITKQNSLGDFKMGVYLWRNADVQLQLSESWNMQQCTLLVFKIVLGKCKSVSPMTGDETIEPTPNFDCHIPQLPARPSDSFHLQINRSQVYLYEYTEDCEPSPFPRQCMPYAVLTYERSEAGLRSVIKRSDSYSKRPPVIKNPPSDSDYKSNKTSIHNSHDPRLRVNESAEDKTLPRDLNALDPNDPRFQLRFLTTASSQSFDGFQYQPSFGPDDRPEKSLDIDIDEVDMEVDEDFSDEPLSSLPPIILPVVPDDTRLMMPDIYPRDPRFDIPTSGMRVNSSDPRLRTTDNHSPAYPPEYAPPSDPRVWSRQTQADPRLNSSDSRVLTTPLDPRLAKATSDPRLQKAPYGFGITHASSDHRLQSLPSDPRLQSIVSYHKLPSVSSDPRLQQQMQSNQNTSQSTASLWQGQRERINLKNDNAKSDEPKIRKKLTLSDYKKKVNIFKTDNTAENLPIFIDAENTSFEPKQQFHYQTQFIGDTNMQPQVFSDARTSSESTLYTTQSVSAAPEDDLWSETDDIDMRVKPMTYTVTKPIDGMNEENDIVEEPDDMAKTLNELSDPEDISQSPKSIEEIEIEEPATEDPMLAEAMQKLVEHSGDVTLFTEALRELQESAEEFGEKLTDPEFLVKKIAEKIEALSKAKKSEMSNEIIIDDDEDDDDGIKSPDTIMSPERSSSIDEPVKDIPLENINADKVISKAESSLDVSMQKTLLELKKVEQQQTQGKESSNTVYETVGDNSKEKSSQRSVGNNNFTNLNLDDIPIPPDPPKPKLQSTQLHGKVESEVRFVNKSANATETYDDKTDDDFGVTCVLPSLNQKKKPVISFNIKRPNKSPEVSELFKTDIDLRTNKQTGNRLETDHGQNKSYKRPVFGLTDEDLRIADEKHNPQCSKNSKTHASRTATTVFANNRSSTNLVEGVNTQSSQENSLESVTSKPELYDPFDLDETDDDIDTEAQNNRNDGNKTKEINKLGDVDWRNTPSDVDLRAENSHSSAGDFDMRQSHSRSVSPTAGVSVQGTRRKENIDLPTSEKVQPSGNKGEVEDFGSNTRKYIDPFGLDDEYISDRALASKPTKLKPNNDSNTGSQRLFDAYNLGKSNIPENALPARNEFGDIDWRQTAAAEMGDVDLRSSKNEFDDGEHDMAKPSNPSNIKLSDNKSEPFVKLNKNIQNMFNQSQNVSQQQSSGHYYASYRTSDSTPPYGHYTTARVPEYRKSNQQKTSEKYHYSTSQGQNKPQVGFQNLMQKLDFSNLKNILATVQQPSLATNDDYTNRKNEDYVKQKTYDNQDEDKPAFVTGLSSAGGRESRKFGRAPAMFNDSKTLNASPSSVNDHKSTRSDVKIPGFDISPDSQTSEEKWKDSNKSTNKMFDNNKRDLSPLKLKTDSCTSDLNLSESLASTPKSKKYDSPRTPKDARIKESNEVMTPLPNISYQAAILESMEQSALKVRHDDSLLASETDDSPLILRKSSKKSENKDKNEKRKDKDTTDGVKKKLKCEMGKNKSAADDDDDDDDEISGLVIDLSPTARTPKPDQSTPTLDERPEDSVDLTQDSDDELMVVEDTKEPVTIDLDDEESIQVKTRDEMTDMIEQSRKNMVIKLKEGTKRVNLKTGKAYSDVSVGSAIEVIGKSSNVPISSSQIIHPIHGIVSSTASSLRSNSPSTSSSTDKHIHSVDKSAQEMLPISSVISGTTRPSSPINFFMGNRTQPQSVQTSMEYVHPITGVMVKYGPRTFPHTHVVGQPIVAAPNQGIPFPSGTQPIVPPVVAMPMPVPVLPLMSQTMNTMSRPASMIQGSTIVVPTQYPISPRSVFQTVPQSMSVVTSTDSRFQYLPRELGGQGMVTSIPNVGHAIQTIGASTTVMNNNAAVTSAVQSDSKADVFDCFRDKFEKRPKDNQSKSYDFDSGVSREKKNVDKTKNYNANNVLVNVETTDSFSKKRTLDDPTPEQTKRQKSAFDSRHSDFGSKILESFAEVKNESPEKFRPGADNINQVKSGSEIKDDKSEGMVPTNSGDVSELEDGEISDDSMNSEEIYESTDRRVVQQISRSSASVTTSVTYNSIPTIGNRFPESPKRIVNISSNYSRPIPTIGTRSNANAYKSVGADWADIIKNPEIKSVERVRASNIESPSLHSGPGSSYDDAASIVSKSAASITKTRQKSKAQYQARTLGEWLKLELEINNIEPLQKIIPYALNTDLTKIPKQRKRRIRMKVKNAIAQEGSKASGSMSYGEALTVSDEEDEAPKPLNPHYAPEVTSEQTGEELKLLLKTLNEFREKLKNEHGTGFDFVNTCQLNSNTPGSVSSEDLKMIGALTHVETEMKLHLSRTCFFGYPHRRVPDELLLISELGGFKSEEEDVFLILMIPLSVKPYNKLVDEKIAIQTLHQRKKSIKSQTELQGIENEIKAHHKQRQAILRGFTGYLNKKRLQKLQEVVNKYTIVYDYYKCVHNPPVHDSMLKFIRTTQMDLRQHLILAKQYLALDEQKQKS